MYDLHELVQVLTDQLAAATKAGDAKQVAELTHKRAARQAKLASYQQEQAHAGA